MTSLRSRRLDLQTHLPKRHPLIGEPDFRRSCITPWAAEDAEPHGCTWPGSFAEAVLSGEVTVTCLLHACNGPLWRGDQQYLAKEAQPR